MLHLIINLLKLLENYKLFDGELKLKNSIQLFLTSALLLFFISELYSEEIKISVLKYGTVNWELNVIKHHELDKKYNVNIDITYLTNKNASSIALLSGKVDMIVTDWVWVNRQREQGEDFTLIPYSTAAGALMVPRDSKIKSIRDIKNHKIGIAGGSIDKSWILMRAYSLKILNLDILENIDPAYAAPPLINAMVLKNDLDGALNFWNYTAKLKAEGLRKVISISDILPQLGIGDSLPLIGYVFSEKWAVKNSNILENFLNASYEARKILKRDDEEWNRIKNITGSKNLETLVALRNEYRKGIPNKNIDYTTPIKRAYKILVDIGGEGLVGNTKELSNGVIWR